VILAAPATAVLLCLTLIGLPLGLAALAIFVFALYLSKILVAGAVGARLLKTSASVTPRYAAALLVGLVLLKLLRALPFVGSLVGFVVLLVGLGLVALGLRDQRRAAA
jgi:hypothetical protein